MKCAAGSNRSCSNNVSPQQIRDHLGFESEDDAKAATENAIKLNAAFKDSKSDKGTTSEDPLSFTKEEGSVIEPKEGPEDNSISFTEEGVTDSASKTEMSFDESEGSVINKVDTQYEAADPSVSQSTTYDFEDYESTENVQTVLNKLEPDQEKEKKKKQ